MKDVECENIVQMYDVIFTDDYTYLVLEYCPDGDLSKYIIKKGGMLEEIEAIGILK
jgi:serine/threonine protein kinase